MGNRLFPEDMPRVLQNGQDATMKDQDRTMEEKLTIAYEYIREETTSLVAKDLSEVELQHLIDYRFGRFLRLLYVEKDTKS